jgi:hypothetical protein
MIDHVLSYLFILILFTIIIGSYLEVPLREGLINRKKKVIRQRKNKNKRVGKENMSGSSERDLGRIEAKVDTLSKTVKDLLSVVNGSESKKIKNYDLLDKMYKQTKDNKDNIEKLAKNSPEANIADSA